MKLENLAEVNLEIRRFKNKLDAAIVEANENKDEEEDRKVSTRTSAGLKRAAMDLKFIITQNIK